MENPVDILAIVVSDNPKWFEYLPEYIIPFGHLCRERSKRKREVVLLSHINDKIMEDIEPVGDKIVCVLDIIETPNNRVCDNLQITLKSLPEIELIPHTPAKKYGQQVLSG